MQPVIIFDIDGTLTDYRKFIEKNGNLFFGEKCGLPIVNPEALEPEEIYGIKSYYVQQGYTEKEAAWMEKKLLDQFWISHRFVLFSLLGRFRENASSVIRSLKRKGFCVEIHTSRAKAKQKNMIGWIARTFTIWQCWLNGVWISTDKIYFYKDDKDKISGIIRRRPKVVFEDKEEIIKKLAENKIYTVCISGVNTSGEPPKYVTVVDHYEEHAIFETLKCLLGSRNYICLEREGQSSRFFKKALIMGFWVRKKYRPIILNSQNMPRQGSQAIVYAPNHIRTVDPLVIESILKQNVHWVALKRFFDGKDSIFNNSKNPLLCGITSRLFKRLEFFPIERKQDNSNANNFDAIKDMSVFLKNGFWVGIFPEGTTRKKDNQFFGTFDRAFVELAKRNQASIQPILIYWVTKGKKKRAVVNFGKQITVDVLSADEIYSEYLRIQANSLEECREWEKRDIHNL